MFGSLQSLIKLPNKICRFQALSSKVMPNRLSLEKSPYLLQHANNPVDWYPWGAEAFNLAKETNKLIFLSVGYSTCHWCHVMEKESFENVEVASIMNENFVNIKVDREERPDVDKVYMSFVQASAGGGGWPMSVFMTPELKPIFGGTYFPPKDMYGRPGFTTVLKAISSQWEGDKSKILNSGQKIIEALQKAESSFLHEIPESSKVSKKCFSQLLKNYDPEMGGFASAPKFPQPVNMNFLFQLYAQHPEEDRSKQSLKMILNTLEMMSLGGINDHVCKGFSRYSTDEKWHVPHFEKMLYDQGQLAVVYAKAFQVTKDEKFARTLRDILEYVNRDLKHPLGGFFSAEDADSQTTFDSEEKKEGAFCVWTRKELEEIIPSQEMKKGGNLLDLFCKVFHVREGGNVDPRGDPHGELKGKNVLTRIGKNKIGEILEHFELDSESELEENLEKCRLELFEARKLRPRPHLDDKIISAWNGLMISGFCVASSALQKPEYSDIAVKAAEFLMEHLYNKEEKVLLRSAYTKTKNEVCQIETPISGFADDYACVIRAFLDLYELVLDPIWIERAYELQTKMDDLFWDNEIGGYFTAAKNDSSIVLRMKEDQDGAEPSANSVAASNLLRIWCFLNKSESRRKAELIFKTFGDRLEKIPLALPEMASALMMYHATPTQIIISGSLQEERTRAMVQLVQQTFIPNKILILADGNFQSIIYQNLDVLYDFPPEKKGQAYICKNFTCSLPISDLDELSRALST